MHLAEIVRLLTPRDLLLIAGTVLVVGAVVLVVRARRPTKPPR